VQPESRSLAFTGNDAAMLDDIIYLDVRTLHTLTIAIMDHRMSTKEAIEIAFGKKGRAAFKLKEWLKEKENKKK
jgi:hypothetical protein